PIAPAAGQRKAGGGLLRGDKHKTDRLESLYFNFLAEMAYDLEPLATGAGQRKAEGACFSATLNAQSKKRCKV
ncbi:hypothetical protein, partial [Cytobacillus massiliigabonensis]|uniref:hypothetical protein n=1 Tax=Cytobacillus massiliigabonensis TaxID=1871011 RepID=UPI001C0FD956